MTPQGLRLFLKLRAHPHNIFVKLPDYYVEVLEMSQIESTDKNFCQLFILGQAA